jgi:hypothetical protein
MFNVDQMALPFDFVTGKTYAPKGARSVNEKSDGPKTWAPSSQKNESKRAGGVASLKKNQ